jgi:pyridoxine kinase
MTKITLTIGGSDTWGGGGIQTDLKTFENLQTFGLSVLTCIAVAENDDFVIRPLPASLIHEQLQTIEQSFQLDGVKIGLLASIEIVDLVIDFCQRNRGQFPIILEPVLAFKETEQQLQQDYLQKIRELAQLVDLITPNLKEMQRLVASAAIVSLVDMETTSQQLSEQTKTAVVLKGGPHILTDSAIDYYTDGINPHYFKGPISYQSTIHGAGCCFSAAICAHLAQGTPLIESIEKSKRFVYEAIENGLPIHDAGNVWHGKIERSLT